MDSLSEEEDDQFFDTKEFITPVSDSGSDAPQISDSESKVVEDVVPGYEVWIRSPGTIRERRHKLFKLMGLAPNQRDGEEAEEVSREPHEDILDNNHRIMEQGGAVLRSSSTDLCSSSHSSISHCSSHTQELLDMGLEEDLVRRIRNLDDGSEFIVDELGQDGLLRILREVGSNRLVSGDEFERILGLSPLVQSVMRRDAGFGQIASNNNNNPDRKRKVKKGWLQRLGALGGINRVESDISFRISKGRTRNQGIRVRTYKKRSKEFSALYMGQDIIAHEGAILTMKFSPDGQFLASAGEDGIVRVWHVNEAESSDLIHTRDLDPSHVYFRTNSLGELVPINLDKEKKGRLKSLRKSCESACVIFPQKVFQLPEKSLHEFGGHEGEVLDLSWSSNKCLLSSSVDKTVRLWRIGFEECLKVFCHNTYVTCIQFNPVDENYFISGSIDGKVRIWGVPGCEVVDWTDIKEIATAVCYQPDGKGVIVGSITSDCYFYDTSDNRLRLTDQTSLHGKKKTPIRRITGFQFCPCDPSKLMVTTADSQVRILKGVDVICKYKGLRNAGSQISASFTSDSRHIVSASEDSFVYVWGCSRTSTHKPISSHVRSNWSYERFFSNNASVTVPWCGTTSCGNVVPSLSGTGTGTSSSSVRHSGIMVRYPTENGSEQHSSSVGFSDPFSRGVATWPEEKLTSANSLVVSSSTCKSEYKFLKTTCQNMAGSPHAWGLVIVTAGWDGRIRVFQNYGLPVRL